MELLQLMEVLLENEGIVESIIYTNTETGRVFEFKLLPVDVSELETDAKLLDENK